MGSGMEVIDVAYATEKGVACFSSPEGNCNAVAEHAIGMLLSLIRRISHSREELKGGIWQREENRGTELEGRTAGIIGYGHTGAAFARKLAGFDMRILAYDKYEPGRIPAHIVSCKSLSPIFEEADIISFHVPWHGDTHHYFNESFVQQMRKPFILINTSRGAVADTQAIYAGITTGKIKGACLDVFEHEPVTLKDTPIYTLATELITHPNVIATPHIAGYTFEALYKMSSALLNKISAETTI
jgi:D-3-phosphoglycerate dehydrogenase